MRALGLEGGSMVRTGICGLAVVLAIWSVVSVSVNAEEQARISTSGESLYENCSAKKATCAAYVSAIADVMVGKAAAFYRYRACFPTELDGAHLALAVTAWLDEHKERLSSPAYILTAEALSEKFPCVR